MTDSLVSEPDLVIMEEIIARGFKDCARDTVTSFACKAASSYLLDWCQLNPKPCMVRC